MGTNDITRKRLIDGARKIFARHGLNKSTVREICAEANANVAAVSYHYGGKDKLYVAVLQDHIERGHLRYPRDEGVTSESYPEEQLKSFVRSILLQAINEPGDDDDQISRLLAHEFIEPSPYFNELCEKYFRPSHRMLQTILSRILPGGDSLTLSRCTLSILGQCLLFIFAREAISILSPGLSLRTENVARITDFIVQFSLGGLSRIRSNSEQPDVAHVQASSVPSDKSQDR